jgi:type IV pilus assembly protein PilB
LDDAAVARRLGDVLIEQGLISASSLARALSQRSQAQANRRRLGHLLVDRGLVTEEQVGRALADLLQLPFVDLRRTQPSDHDVRSIPRAIAEAHGLLVLTRSEDVVRIGTDDPKNVVGLDDARLHTGATRLEIAVVAETPMREIIARAWGSTEGARAVVASDTDDFSDADADADIAAAEDAPIVRLAGRLLADAVRARASDIHVEPQESGVRVRFRVDGVLRHAADVPTASRAALTSRLKIIAGMDIAERRVPQDGRVRLEIDGSAVDARVSTLPSLHGEKVVIRLLTPAHAVPELSDLGLASRDLDALHRALQQPQGLILITGPTGSGKTSTLFSALRAVNTPERNIVTLEDPIEIQLPGLTQVQINERTGLTFARGLRSVLRQDPDVVLVGEIRDLETAQLAMRAALTGHLVLATLHTNDAISAMTRLVDMGIEDYVVASALSLVVAQRLLRATCSDCADRFPLPNEADGGSSEYSRQDCPRCDGTGYRGRIGVFEVVEIDADLRRLMAAGADEAALAASAAEAGTRTLRTSALHAAEQGRTTTSEALRVTADPLES